MLRVHLIHASLVPLLQVKSLPVCSPSTPVLPVLGCRWVEGHAASAYMARLGEKAQNTWARSCRGPTVSVPL